MARTASFDSNERGLSGAGPIDWGLLSLITAMLIFGLIMVFSASYPYSVAGKDHPFYFVNRQLLWMALGVVAMVVAARVPYTLMERWSIPMMAATLVALVVLMFVGSELFGSTRTFFNGSVQPSEPAKIVIIIYIAAWLTSKGERIRNVSVGLIPFSVLLGFLTLLIVLQPSISTAVIIVATASIMFFIAGAELKQLLVVAIGASATFWLIIQYSSYANERLGKYIESIWNPLFSREYQVQQGVEAMTRGGPLGVGIGQGQAQLPGFLPLSWTDNIFAVIGEELGLIGTLLVILLFALLTYRGIRIALRCKDNFGMLLATGITAWLALQALLNAAVVVSVAPPTGVTLPFFSYGGSSLLTAMTGAGILLSISRYGGVLRGGRSRPSTANMETGNHADSYFWRRNRRPRLPSPGRGGTTGQSSSSGASRSSKSGRSSSQRRRRS